MGGWLASLLTLLLAAPAAALEFENGAQYQPSRHDRFVPGSYPGAPVANPGFFLGDPAFDWSGVGWEVAHPGKRVALISPLHVLNANHFRIGGQLAFAAADGAVHVYTVRQNVAVIGDIAVATLDRPVAPGIAVFPVAPVVAGEHDGSEVLYVGRAPGGIAFTVGRTAIEFSASSTSRLSSLVVDGEGSTDRVRGISGDSGSPSFFDGGDGLVLVGHHVGGYSDQYLGYTPARDAVDDFLAAEGFLLDIRGEGRVGDPESSGLVATRLSPDLVVELAGDGVGAFRLHDFSGGQPLVSVEVESPGLAARLSGDASADDRISFTAPADARGVAVEVLSTGASTGTLRVSDGGASFSVAVIAGELEPVPTSVALSLDPAMQQSGAESESLYYAVTVTNEDRGAEVPAELALSASGPAGWLVSVAPASVNLAPGESADAGVYVTPVPGAAAGSYDFQVEVHDAAEPAHDASAPGRYEIVATPEESADTSAPTPPTGLDANGNHRRSEVTWQASTDDVGVASYEVIRDGEVVGYTDASPYRDGPYQRGRSYRYSVRAYDAAGNASQESDSIDVVNGSNLASAGGDEGGDSGGDGGGPGICQATHSRERGRRCRDGVDNDCDGWIDAADPDC